MPRIGETRRRWFQFGLRTLFITITLCAIGLGVWRWLFNDYWREQAVLGATGSRGVEVEAEYVSGVGAKFWSRVFGTNLYQRVTRLTFTTPPSSDFDMARLAGLHHPRELSLKGCPLDDDQLAGLSELRELEMLDLSGTLATDITMTRLEGLKKLEYLGTAGTMVSYAALERLQSHLPAVDDLCHSRAIKELKRPGIDSMERRGLPPYSRIRRTSIHPRILRKSCLKPCQPHKSPKH